MNLELKSKQHLLNTYLLKNKIVAANNGKKKDNYNFNIFLNSAKLLKKITKQLGFHITFKTADLQDINFLTVADEIKVNFDKLFLFVPIFNPNAETQIIFNDSIKKSFTLSFDSWSTDRKTADTQLEYQIHIGSVQKSNSPKYLIVAHQTTAGK